MPRINHPSYFATWLKEFGQVFKTIGDHDSGNISYGVKNKESKKYFIKFAPSQNLTAIKFLENAYILGENISHPILVELKFGVNCRDGLALVYDWVEGENLNEVTTTNKPVIMEIREAPGSPYSRFKSLPVEEIVKVLNQIFDLHVVLEKQGYVSCDWYDGCIIYNFAEEKVHIIDLDLYNKGPFPNSKGRMYGSSRFMAPEEFEPGEIIDNRTTVYHMGATVFEFLGRGKKEPEKGFRGSRAQLKIALKAIQDDKKERYCSVQEFFSEWLAAL